MLSAMGLPAELLDAALALSEQDRDELATRLLSRLGTPPGLSADTPGFAEELQRRSAALKSGEDPGADWEQVREAMRSARASA